MDDLVARRLSQDIQAYREMAQSCRKMAAATRRPGPLLLRAEAYEATALALEGGRNSA